MTTPYGPLPELAQPPEARATKRGRTRGTLRFREQTEPRPPEFGAQKMSSGIPIPETTPEGFGSIPEWLVFTDLVRRHFQPEVDFTYRPRFFGGAVTAVPQLGTIEIDFVMKNPPDLGINVQGVFFHYEQGVEQKARDIMARAQLATLGIRVIFIDDDHILQDVHYYVGEALKYRDHSRISRGFM